MVMTYLRKCLKICSSSEAKAQDQSSFWLKLIESLLGFGKKISEESQGENDFDVLKLLVVDLVSIVFDQQICNKAGSETLRKVSDFVFCFGELTKSFLTLVSDVRYKKGIANTGVSFVSNDFFKAMSENKTLAVFSLNQIQVSVFLDVQQGNRAKE